MIVSIVKTSTPSITFQTRTLTVCLALGNISYLLRAVNATSAEPYRSW